MALQPDKLERSTLTALVEASAAINSSLDLRKVLDAIAQSAADVMHAEAGSVLLFDKRRNKLVFLAATGESAQAVVGEEFDSNLGIAGKVITTGRPQLVSDVNKNPDFFKGIDNKSSFQTRGLIAAPLIHQDEVIGVVEVLNRKSSEGFADEDLDLLQVFGNLAATGVTNAQAHETLARENLSLRSTMQAGRKIIGDSDALQQVLNLCNRVAPSTASVLLLGETGTGKELIARYLHDRSPRRDKPFIAINCAALAETLLESELFGHEKGAFTGAVGKKLGRFELADGGTLLLDEIGEISPAIQVKLLRVLQEKEFVRVGGTQTVACNVRIIASTNRDLKSEMEQGRIRQDLYYRLNVFPINNPPLRERRDDIPKLAEHFITQASAELNVPCPTITDDTTAVLVSYRWPGNIRELQNVIERAVLLSDGDKINPSHLPREIAGDSADTLSTQGDSSLWGYERALILKALNDANWNQSQAARQLGISRDNLRYRVKKYKLEKPSA